MFLEGEKFLARYRPRAVNPSPPIERTYHVHPGSSRETGTGIGTFSAWSRRSIGAVTILSGRIANCSCRRVCSGCSSQDFAQLQVATMGSVCEGKREEGRRDSRACVKRQNKKEGQKTERTVAGPPPSVSKVPPSENFWRVFLIRLFVYPLSRRHAACGHFDPNMSLRRKRARRTWASLCFEGYRVVS